MNWSTIRLSAFNVLLRWLVGSLWPAAVDAVQQFQQRSDLAGADKKALALEILAEEAKTLGLSLANSVANFLIEAAVQVVKAKAS